ncbi:MAG TPA: thioredoxin-like domain-containing protein, partial [Trichocoleus sp.]
MVRTRAPELSQTAPWLNCDGSLSLRALRGKVVLLDFWTYGCINCLHTLPDLHYLEAKYRDRVIVIGVHTAKFEQEQNPEAVQQAIWRYGITHPVVVDCDRTVWDQYAIRAWPTFVVINPQGYVVATVAGEGQRERLEQTIEKILGGEREAETEQAAFADGSLPRSSSPLAFPGKVVVDGPGNRLLIADTGHHRIVMTTLAGEFRA